MKNIFAILVLASQTAWAGNDCRAEPVGRLLDSLETVKILHNCSIEVVSTIADSPYDELRNETVAKTKSYVVRAQDDFRCSHGFGCPKIEMELHVPIECKGVDEPTQPGTARFSYGTKIEGEEVRSLFDFTIDPFSQISSLRLAHVELATGKKIQEVVCESEIFFEEEN